MERQTLKDAANLSALEGRVAEQNLVEILSGFCQQIEVWRGIVVDEPDRE
jgi:hypothetical protein